MKFNFFKNMSKKVVNAVRPKTKDAENVGKAFSDIADEVNSGNCNTLIELAKKLKESNIIKQYYLKNTNNSAKKFSIAGVSVTAFINMIRNQKVVVGTNDRLSFGNYCKLCSAFLVKPFEVSIKKDIVKSDAMVRAFKDADSGKKNLGEQLSNLVNKYYKVEPEVQSTDVKIDTSAEEKTEKNNEADDTKSIESVMKKGRATWVSSVFTHKSACDGVVKLLDAIYNKWVKDKRVKNVPFINKYYTTDDIPAKSQHTDLWLDDMFNITNDMSWRGMNEKALELNLMRLDYVIKKRLKKYIINGSELTLARTAENISVVLDKNIIMDKYLCKRFDEEILTFLVNTCEKLKSLKRSYSLVLSKEFCDEIVKFNDRAKIIKEFSDYGDVKAKNFEFWYEIIKPQYEAIAKIKGLNINLISNNYEEEIAKNFNKILSALQEILNSSLEYIVKDVEKLRDWKVVTLCKEVINDPSRMDKFIGMLHSCKNVVIYIDEGITEISLGTLREIPIPFKIIIPSSVVTINNDAFRECVNLEEVIFSSESRLAIIGNNAFKSCKNLKKINLPQRLEAIGEKAFFDCGKLTSITDCAGGIEVIDIGNRVFDECEKLQDLNNIKKISKSEDYRKNVSAKINVDPGISIIRENAFCGLLTLKEVILPDGLKIIGDESFLGCKNLTNVKIPESVESINGGAFENCLSFTEIVIPKNVKEIENCAFKGCSKLKRITFLGNTPHMGCDVFSDCENLEEVIFFKKIDTIDMFTFKDCNKLSKVKLNLELAKDSGVSMFLKSYENLELIEILDGVTEIGKFTFGYCPKVTSIIFPNSVIKFDKYAFYYCPKLTSIVTCDGIAKVYAGDFFLGKKTINGMPYFEWVSDFNKKHQSGK